MDRRQFLKTIAVGTCGAACHNILRPGGMMAYALPSGAPPPGPIRRFIEIFFYGGYCDYGFMPQHNNGAKAKYPSLYRTPVQAAPIVGGHPDISLHQAFQPLVAEAGQHIALVLKTGNPTAYSRSHEDAQNANQRIDLDPSRSNGMGVGAAIMAAIGQPYAGIAFGGSSTFMTGGPITARSINSLQNAGRPDFYNDEWFEITEQNIAVIDRGPQSAEQEAIAAAISGMQGSLKTLQSVSQIQTQFAYPNTSMGNTFRDINKLIIAGLGNIFFVPYGGFDTHSNQAQQHQASFSQLNAALLAFVRNLKAIPDPAGGTMWESTAVLTRTDFGRTVENNAQGTDHGMAHNQMVIGGSITGGVYGDPLTEQQFLRVGDYYGSQFVQFSSGQATKDIVERGMGLTNVGLPLYPGNIRAPIGFI